MSGYHKLLAKSIEVGPTPILITDSQGIIVFANTLMSKSSGYSNEELIGQSLNILNSEETRKDVYDDLWQTVLGGDIWQGNLLSRKKNGDIQLASLFMTPTENSEDGKMYFIGFFRGETGQLRVEEEKHVPRRTSEVSSTIDGLTGQYSRQHIFLEIQRELERSSRHKSPLTGMLIDLDDFKKINDKYGHSMGDRLIKAFALVIKQSIRKIDVLGRYAGDEFIVILPETPLDPSKIVAERVQKNLLKYQTNILNDISKCTTSIGLFSFNDVKDVNAADFIGKISDTLLEAKKTGKNKITAGSI